MNYERENPSWKSGLIGQAIQQAWDWVLDHADTALSIVIALMAVVTIIVSNFSFSRLIPAIVIFALTALQYWIRHKSKERIEAVRRQLAEIEKEKGEWKTREDEYQEQIRKLHEGNKAALTAWVVTLFEACDLDHSHRLSLFILSRDHKVAYLLTRYSANPTISGVSKNDYGVDGAVGLAWQERRHIGPLMAEPGKSKTKHRQYVSAVTKVYGVKKTRVEQSRMRPRHYASWRLDVGDSPTPTILVFESQIDSRAKVETLEQHILGDESRAMRHLADLVREYEIQSRESTKIDIEGGAT